MWTVSDDVQKARSSGNTEAIRNFASHGGKKSQRNRRKKKEAKERTLALQLRGAQAMAEEAHEDICPVD